MERLSHCIWTHRQQVTEQSNAGAHALVTAQLLLARYYYPASLDVSVLCPAGNARETIRKALHLSILYRNALNLSCYGGGGGGGGDCPSPLAHMSQKANIRQQMFNMPK